MDLSNEQRPDLPRAALCVDSCFSVLANHEVPPNLREAVNCGLWGCWGGRGAVGRGVFSHCTRLQNVYAVKPKPVIAAFPR